MVLNESAELGLGEGLRRVEVAKAESGRALEVCVLDGEYVLRWEVGELRPAGCESGLGLGLRR